eukprot:scaffold75668_cov75-Phaeocystis_antarctica.AAC.3
MFYIILYQLSPCARPAACVPRPRSWARSGRTGTAARAPPTAHRGTRPHTPLYALGYLVIIITLVPRPQVLLLPYGLSALPQHSPNYTARAACKRPGTTVPYVTKR